MPRITCHIICGCVFILYGSLNQSVAQTGGSKVYTLTNPQDYKGVPKTCILLGINQTCKLHTLTFYDTAASYLTPKPVRPKLTIVSRQEPITKRPLITVHGNVMYDFYYQSHLDTPYIGKDLYQHTLTTFLDVRIRDDYPMRVYFTTRFGNTNYLRNITNLNLQYSPQTFQNTVRQRIKAALQQQLDTSQLSTTRDKLESKMQQLQALKSWISSPSVLQKLVEAREAAYIKQRSASKLPNIPLDSDLTKDKVFSSVQPASLRNPWSWLSKLNHNQHDTATTRKDSSARTFSNEYAQKKKQLDSVTTELEALQQKYLAERDSLFTLKNTLTSKINAARNPQQLQSLIHDSNLSDSALPKGYNKLLAVKKFGIGTSTVDYSELSAKNITITGLQVEYSPKFYYAVAGGVIDYRFRDYLLPSIPGPKQYLGLVRFGKETRNGNSLILTYYYGRKVLYNYYSTDSVLQTTLPTPNYNLMGFTLENKIKLNANSYLTAEVAKSSIPYYHTTNTSNGDKSLTGTFNLSDRSNEAYSLKINSVIPETGTRIDAYFKHYGANFQSFTLVTTSSEQNAWLMNVNQDLFHNQLTINGSIRKNDYINPFLDQRYVSNTIFKSIQATLHIPNLPVISAGFYPTTQLTKLNDQNYMENLFYSLTASASYLYNRKHTMMSTNLMYMRFYNRPADSGFIYYNTNNFFLNHSIFFRTVTLQTSLSDAINTNYTLWSWGEDAQVHLKKWLSLGGGFKYNKQSLIEEPQIGYTLDGNVKIGSLGTVQFRGEKTYIPSINNKLVANNIGRITYYRNF